MGQTEMGRMIRYGVEFLPRALKDFKRIPRTDMERIFDRVERMRDDLAGDVKRLVHFTTEYRLRVGDYRVLFNIEGNIIVVWRVLQRAAAYDW